MPSQSTTKFFTSSLLLFSISGVYLYVIYLLTHQRLWMEVTISIIFPAIIFALGKAPHFKARVKQLFFIESSFNVLAILSIMAILFSLQSGHTLLALGFVGFFLIQTGGFIVYQIQQKKYLSVSISFALLGFILSWLMSLNYEITSVIDAEGRFLMWGVEAPLSIKIMYIIWVLNPMFVDSQYLPKITQAVAHIPSLILSWWSGEFFHVRLLTACHLFLLDGMIGYGKPSFMGQNFCSIPEKHQQFFSRVVQPTIQYGGIILTISLIIASFTWGLDLTI